MNFSCAVAIKIFCTFEWKQSYFYGKANTCLIKRAIDTEESVLSSPVDVTVKQFHIDNNREILFLPRKIGQNFPKLIEFLVRKSGLMTVRHFYFNDMQKLERLHLVDNSISVIEAGSFKDLISVETLSLDNNLIETLVEDLFAPMIKLEEITLKDNNIKFLKPTTFEIPNGRLITIDLLNNVCISERQNKLDLNTWAQLESDLTLKCGG